MNYEKQIIKQIIQDKTSKKKYLDMINKRNIKNKKILSDNHNDKNEVYNKLSQNNKKILNDNNEKIFNDSYDMQKQINELQNKYEYVINLINDISNELNIIKNKISE